MSLIERAFPTRPRGFSLLEVIVVLVIALVVSSFAIIQIRSIQRNLRAEAAYQTVVMQLRRARQEAIDRRRVHRVSFSAPRTIIIDRINSATDVPASTPVEISRLDLPADIQYQLAEVAAPTTLDNITLAEALNFSTDDLIWFQPDGSALDTSGRIRSGSICIARPNDPPSTRAVTLLGATGRIKGWRLVNQSGSWVWQ
jgi:prepilin-type N-terminal cleavage/methylation domain-containing protein